MDSSSTIAILLLFIPAIVCYWEKWTLTPLVFTTFFLSFILVGYSELDRSNGSNTLLGYFIGTACFLAGYFCFGFMKRAERVASVAGARGVRAKRNDPAIMLFAIIVSSLAIYHIMAVGIPALSRNPDMARWDFTSSGLFGVPGRMYLFGMPFLAILVSTARDRNLAPVSSKLVAFVWIVFSLVNAGGGFKGGLVKVVGVMLLVAAVSNK